MKSAELPLLILGWCSLLYGVTELVNALKIHSIRKAANRQAEEMERQRKMNEETVAEEISSEINKVPAETQENAPAETENVPAEIEDAPTEITAQDEKQENAPAENRESEEDYPDFIG